MQLGIGRLDDDAYNNVAQNIDGTKVEASSTADNPVNLPEKMLDESEDSWISMGGVEEADVTVKFSSLMMVNEIEITWSFPPKAF